MLFASVPLLLILICLSNAEECQWKVTNLATKVEAPVVVAVTVSQIVDINSQSLGKFIVFSTFKTTPDFRNFMRLNGDVITLPIQSKLSTSKSSASKSCLNRRDLERKPKHKHVLFLNSYGNVSLFRPIKFNKVKSAEIWELAQDSSAESYKMSKAEVAVGSQFHLNCKIKGQPHETPDVLITHNGHYVQPSNSVVIEGDRLSQKVKVTKFTEDWAGTYECSARRPDGQYSRVYIKVDPKAVEHNTTVYGEIACPIDLIQCENGGTCYYQPSIHSASCKCAYGFSGKHCAYRDVEASCNAIKGYHQNMLLAVGVYSSIFLILIAILIICARKRQQMKRKIKQNQLMMDTMAVTSDNVDSLPPVCPYCRHNLSTMVSVENSNGQISPNGDLPQIHEVQRLLNSDDLESGAISPNQESNTYPKIQVPQNLNGLMSNEFRKDRINAVSDMEMDSPKSPVQPPESVDIKAIPKI